MRHPYAFSVVVTVLLVILISACTPGTPNDSAFENFDPNNFENPTNIDNTWLPLKPGTQFVYEGFTNDDEGNSIPRRLVVTVTDLTKVIDGVRSVVSWDLDYNADELVEAELAFYAQDNSHTVWRMGEHPEEVKDGKVIDSPTWISGIKDAVAGIEMLGDPQQGAPSYSQGWGPEVDFTDRGEVSQVGQKVCIPFACYENVLVIKESNQSEPDAFQFKYFAHDIGNIMVDWTGEDQTKETLELVDIVQLTSDQMTEVHAKALELEKHAYEISQDVYGQTQPSE